MIRRAINDNAGPFELVRRIETAFGEPRKIDPARVFAPGKVKTTEQFDEWLTAHRTVKWARGRHYFDIHRPRRPVQMSDYLGASLGFITPWWLAVFITHELGEEDPEFANGMPVHFVAEDQLIVMLWQSHDIPLFDAAPPLIRGSSATTFVSPVS